MNHLDVDDMVRYKSDYYQVIHTTTKTVDLKRLNPIFIRPEGKYTHIMSFLKDHFYEYYDGTVETYGKVRMTSCEFVSWRHEITCRWNN